MLKRRVLVLVVLVLAVVSCGQSDQTATYDDVPIYLVGNSLTLDTMSWKVEGVRGFDKLAQQAGHSFTPYGYHVNCGASLAAIWANPTKTCNTLEDPGPIPEALPSDAYAAPTAQPYPGGGSTLTTDVEAIAGLAALVDAETEVFILATWPPATDFEDTWTAPLDDVEDPRTVASAAYYERLMQALEVAGVDAAIIPVGEVMYSLHRALPEEPLEDMTSIDALYRDRIHLNEAGQWLSGAVLAATVLQADPGIFEKPDGRWYGDGSAFPEGFVGLAQQVMDDVLSGG